MNKFSLILLTIFLLVSSTIWSQTSYKMGLGESTRGLITIRPTLLLKKILLVPYYDQGNTEWCVPTSMAMIFKYFGKNIHSWDIAEYWDLGIEDALGWLEQDDKIIKYFNNHGLNAEKISDADNFDVIKSQIDNENPLMLLMFGIGHAVVVVGYSLDGDSEKVYINDPGQELLPTKYISGCVDWEDVAEYAGGLSYVITVGGKDPSPPKGTIDIGATDGPIWNGGFYFSYEGEPYPQLYICMYGLDKGLDWDYNKNHPHPLALNEKDRFRFGGAITNYTRTNQTYKLEIKFASEDFSPEPKIFSVSVDSVSSQGSVNEPIVEYPISMRDYLKDKSGEYTITLTLWNSDLTEKYDEIVFPSIEYTSPDTTPPETEITSAPAGEITYNNVSFTWSGSDDVTPTSELLYSYYLEGYDSDWTDWTSDTIKEYKDLPNGEYTFKIMARDEAGNVDPTPAENLFTISVSQVIYVPDDYLTIQEAIDSANTGDTIIVSPGTYIENVQISKALTLQSEHGPEYTIIEAASANAHAVQINAGSVSIVGFTLSGASAENKAGTAGNVIENCTIRDNIARDNYAGIVLNSSYNNIITGNICIENQKGGIVLANSTGNTITQNRSSNSEYGIYIREESGNCAVEQAVHQIHSANSQDLLPLLRRFRDTQLKQEYVYMYNQYSPEIKKIFIKDPKLSLKAAELLITFQPAIRSILKGQETDMKVTDTELQKFLDFTASLKQRINNHPNDFNSNSKEKILYQIRELENQVRYFKGHEIVQAFRNSVYIKDPTSQYLNTTQTSSKKRYSTSENTIYLNEFYANDQNAYSEITNTWHSPEPVVYTFYEKNYRNHLGNYWGNYSGMDQDGNGVGDSSYFIGSGNMDDYPLTHKIDQYNIETFNIKFLNVPFFSQRDSRWSGEFLDNSHFTIGIYGCALTSTAMVVNYYGVDTDPSRLNNSLTPIGGIDENGLLHWEKVPEVCGGKVTWEGRIDLPDWSKINSEIDQGYPVIADVRTPSDDQHFVVVWGKAGSDYYFYDSADLSATDRIWPAGWHGTYTLVGLRIYHGTPTSLDSGLIAYYPFNGSANDESNNGYDGTVYGATLTTDRFGNESSAYIFDGIDDYIEIGDLNINTDFTVGAWILPKHKNVYQYIFMAGDRCRDGYWSIAFNINNSNDDNLWYLSSGVQYGTTHYPGLSTYDIIQENKWSHVVFTKSDTNGYLYNNGVLVNSTNSFPTNLNDVNIHTIGAKFQAEESSSFYGTIDDIRIYNRALTETEVQTLYTGLMTQVNKNRIDIPYSYSLCQNYPNPFNPITTIKYQLPISGKVQLDVYNLRGQLVETLVSEHKEAGYYTVQWDASEIVSGVYFYRIQAGDTSTGPGYGFTDVKKCILLK